MVSAQISGVLNFYRVDSNNNRTFIFGGDIAGLGPSGSSQGAIASTPEKWTFIPLQNSADKVLRVNEKLLVTFTPVAAATTAATASYSRAVIPITYQNGSSTTLSNFSNSVDWDVTQLPASLALVAGYETIIAIKTARQAFALGSNVQKVFASIENNS